MKISKAIKQEKFKSNQNMAIINILYTSNWLKDYYKSVFDPFELKSQHYNVLRILKGRYPNATSPGEIKEVMLDKAPDLTRLIDKLVLMKLVDRNLCSENRRKVDVLINKKGIELLDKIDVKMNVFDEMYKLKLNNKEAEQLSNLLDKLRS